MLAAHPILTAALVAVPVAAALVGFPVIAWGGVCTGIVAGSFIVHEAAHALAFRLVAGRDTPAMLRTTALAADLVWRSTGVVGRDLIVILAGPAAPAVVAVPLVVATSGNLVVLFAAGATAASHLISLALRDGDGGQLRAVLRADPVGR